MAKGNQELESLEEWVKIAIIGCGVMGSAFAHFFSSKQQDIVLYDSLIDKSKSLAEQVGGKAKESAREAVKNADLILLAVKPKDLKSSAQEIGSLTKHQILLSILAGVSSTALKKYFGSSQVVRAMSNLALLSREAVVALSEDKELSAESKAKIEQVLMGLGMIFWIEETKIEAVTALAGSGPGFIFVILEAMIESGIYMGFTAEESKSLALQTIKGAVSLLQTMPQQHPAEMKWRVCSPGGTTIVGIKELEHHQVRYGIMSAILATYQRAQEIFSEF